MTSYLIYTSGMTIEKGFISCTKHLGGLPICALYDVLCELPPLLPSQTRHLILQVSIQQVHAFLACHGNHV